MKILVFVKQVPDTTDVKLDPKTGNLNREGVVSILNALDANGVEAALQLKEKYGATVVAVSMGPPQAEEVLKRRWLWAAMKQCCSATEHSAVLTLWPPAMSLPKLLRR